MIKTIITLIITAFITAIECAAAASSQFPEPQSVSVNTFQDAVQISWSSPENGNNLLGYNIYRDGTRLNGSTVASTSYLDYQVIESTVYSYSVSAVYSDGESRPTETVEIEVPRHGAPANVAAAITPDGIYISWDALPQYPTNISRVVEDFSRYNPTTQSSLTDMLDGWTMYNGEPGRNHRYTYESAWGIRSDSDGNIYLTGSYIEGYTAPLNDWIISPLLNTSAQTITLRAAKSYAQYPESFVIKYSSATNRMEDFSDISGASVADSDLSTEWRDFTFRLPDGAKYFAIVCTSKEGDRLKLDDISYIPASYPQGAPKRTLGTLCGYNIYVNGERVNPAIVADTHYVYAPGRVGDFSVGVSGVYTTYETSQGHSAPLTVDASKIVLPELMSETFTHREELGNIYLSWEEPLQPDDSMEGSEDFDSYSAGAFPAEASGFTAINRSGVNHVENGVGYNAFIIRKTEGETFLYTSCAPAGIDDWLISPELNGVHSVSFDAIAEFQSEERVELYCADKDTTDPSDFTLVKTFVLPKYTPGATWIDCKSELPEGACRFALRACTPTYGNGIRIDNIKWSGKSDLIISNVVGYTLYHRVANRANLQTDKKAAPEGYVPLSDSEYRTWNSERGIEAHYTTSVPGTHQFAVAAKYPWGESEPAYFEDLVVTGVEAVRANEANENLESEYYTIDGRRLTIPTRGQIVIVRTPSSTRKILWSKP